MRRLRTILGLACAALAALAIPAQSQNHRALAEGAERAGDFARAVSEYALLLQSQLGEEDDFSIRERTIDLCQRLPAKLAVPEDALRRFARARAFAKEAKTKDEFRTAADEYREGLKLAPCEADAYFNYALVLEIAEQAERAITALKLYLRSAPNAPDAAKVRSKLYELEAKVEMKARRSEARGTPTQPMASGRCPQGFGGAWSTSYGMMDLRVAGNSVEGTFPSGQIHGLLDGRTLRGEWNESGLIFGGAGTLVFTLTPDGHSFSGTWTRASGFGNPGGTWEGQCRG